MSICVTFVQQDGQEVVVDDATCGESLMEIAKANGVAGIMGDCGGGAACATCHVYVPPQWQEVVGPPNEIEAMTLDMVDHVRRKNSRLSCQIQAGPEIDGLRLEVAPEE